MISTSDKQKFNEYIESKGYRLCKRGEWGMPKNTIYYDFNHLTSSNLDKNVFLKLVQDKFGKSSVGGREYAYPNSQKMRKEGKRSKDVVRLVATMNAEKIIQPTQWRKLTFSFALNQKKIDCPCCGAKNTWRKIALYENGKETDVKLPDQYGKCDRDIKCGAKNIPAGRQRKYMLQHFHSVTIAGENNPERIDLPTDIAEYTPPKHTEGEKEIKRFGLDVDIQELIWEHFVDNTKHAYDRMDADDNQYTKKQKTLLAQSWIKLIEQYGCDKAVRNSNEVGIYLGNDLVLEYLQERGININSDQLKEYLSGNYDFNSIVYRHNNTGFVFNRSVDTGYAKYLKQSSGVFNSELVGAKDIEVDLDDEWIVVEGYREQVLNQYDGLNVVSIGTKSFSEQQFKHFADKGINRVILNWDSEYDADGQHKHKTQIVLATKYLKQYGIQVKVLELYEKDLMDYWDVNDVAGGISTIRQKIGNAVDADQWIKEHVDMDDLRYKHIGHWIKTADDN